MPSLKLYGKDVLSIFQLLGYQENDISHSTAWVLSKCKRMLDIFVNSIFSDISYIYDEVQISVQVYDKSGGITDIEITDNKEFYIIVEAKRGWNLPSKDQIQMYSDRLSFRKSIAVNKCIVTLSECSRDYANHYLPLKNANGILVKHLSWKDIYKISETAYLKVSNSEKRMIIEFQQYLKGVITMQNKNSNEVYVVSLSSDFPQNSSISWIDIVRLSNSYFHPVGAGWPKEPPNYIAFRYNGKLQSIHHIENYTVMKNPHDYFVEMADVEWEPHYLYTLGPAIYPPKHTKTGNIFRSGRVWCHLDLLLTCDSIAEARDLTQKRM